MNLKKIIRSLLFVLSAIILTYCATVTADPPSGNLPDKNLYLITTNGNLNSLSQNNIDAEYNTFLFLPGETRKIYLGGKLPANNSDYNAVWLENTNIWQFRHVVSLTEVDDNNYYSVLAAPTDIPTAPSDYPVVAKVGNESTTYTSYGTKNITLKVVPFYEYRDWGLNVYQQSGYNSLDLTKSSILNAFSEMKVFLGTNGENIINRNSSLPDLNVIFDYNATAVNLDQSVIYAFSKIYPGIPNTATAITTYFSEHPNEGILFYVKDYTPINQPPNPPLILGFTRDKEYTNAQYKLAPISFICVQRIKDVANSSWEDKEIKATTVHELGHLWCGTFTDDANHNLWHNGENKNQCAMKFHEYWSSGDPDDTGKKILNHIGFCEGHLQRGMNISWQLKQYSPYGQSSQMHNYKPELYVSNSYSSKLIDDNLKIELVCGKKNFVQGELMDVLVKLSNVSGRTITINSPTHFLHDKEKDTLIVKQDGNSLIKIEPFGTYYYFIDPLEYIGYNEKRWPGVPWYYWNKGTYEYYISHYDEDKQIYSNKLTFDIQTTPDSLSMAFSDLQDDLINIPKINTENYTVEKYESLAEKYKDTFFEKEFYYKLLISTNYYNAIQNKEPIAKCLREKALSLYSKYILKYPNTSGSYTLFNWIYSNYNENSVILEDIIGTLKNSSPTCWLLLVLNNQPVYMFKEIKHLLK